MASDVMIVSWQRILGCKIQSNAHSPILKSESESDSLIAAKNELCRLIIVYAYLITFIDIR